MDIIIDIFDFIFEELPRRVAVGICATIGTLVAIVGFAVRGHYHRTYEACHTTTGQMAQAFSNVASSSCSTANLMTKGGLIVGLLGAVVAGIMLLWLFKLLVEPPQAATE
ncbi:MAG TPA: hypothetical protein VFG42_03625 [Baekduia sp.]|uniref:hypothetical protein n=1 Tax=Baekduia sp. TaxID=2600305 RepID=UPI002D771D1F|nr:hypothetical protein [Baekduia sp.]HET6505854.1 hypothetical protein [Baekduia sp.]